MMRKRILYFLFIFILSGIFTELKAKAPSCFFNHYSTHDGLSHSGVMCILQDHMGLMWFGTWDGLNKFDGYHFTTYKSKSGDTGSLSHNRVEYIMEDIHGYIWVMTYDQSIHRFDPRLESFTSFPGPEFQQKDHPYHFSSIYQSPQGDIWLISNNEGCFRIITNSDKKTTHVLHYSSEQTDSLYIPDNHVQFVYGDSFYNTWICTQKGLKVISSGKKILIPESMKHVNYTAAFEYNSLLFLGSSEGKIFAMNHSDQTISEYKLPLSASIIQIKALKEGNLLIGTKDQGLILYNLNTKLSVIFNSRNHPFLTDDHIKSLYIDKYGIAWIENDSAGVVRFDPEKLTFKRFRQITENVSPYVYYGDYFTVFEDVNDILWINLKKGGFCYYNRKADQIEYFYNEPGSPDRRFSNLVTSVISDRTGNLWMSTHSRGIEKISFIQNKFKYIRPVEKSNTLSSNDVRSVFEDRQGHLWIGTKEGKLFCYYNNQLKREFSGKKKYVGDMSIDGMVYCITQSDDGALWFGTKGDGVIRAEYVGSPEKLHFKTTHIRNNEKNPAGLNHNWVYSIFQDSKKRIWIGTYGGGLNLLMEKEDGYQIFNHSSTVFRYPFSECNQIRHILEDSEGYIWVGTTNGLVIVDPDKKRPDWPGYIMIRKEPGYVNGLANNDVHYILKDSQNRMWVSTFGGGLGKVVASPVNTDKIKFKNYSVSDGLPIDIILSMLEDKQGNLWLATENGLSKMNWQHETFTNFSESDGLKNLIFSESAACKGSDGLFYFGSADGIYSFYPKEIETDYETPEVILVNFQLFNKDIREYGEKSILQESITLTDAITLHYDQSVFSIEYAGLYLKNPEKIQYAFKLEGFEKDWNCVRKQRKATYTNLPAGRYVFKVKCSITGNFEEVAGRELLVTILPPPWKTTWAYILYFLAGTLIILLARRIIVQIITLKHKVLLEHQLADLKIRFFTNISHELRTPLSLIISPVQDLLKNEAIQEKTRESLEIIDKNARRMLSHINNLLDFRKIQTGKMKLNLSEIELVSFIRDIYEGFSQAAKIQEIEFSFASDMSFLNVWIDPEKIDTIVFNLVSNALKFTPKGKKIELTISKKESDKFQIIIRDEGIGISSEELPHIFERFKVSHQTDDYLKKGTGIGLSVVKEIVSLHKGTIDVESIEGQGSVFIVTMYTGTDHYAEGEVHYGNIIQEHYIHSHLANIDTFEVLPEKLSYSSSKQAPVILIIEDNYDLRNYLCNKLAERFGIIAATDGKDGWDKAREHIPDLIVSDIMMPGYDGIKLLSMLRNDINTSHIPIILLTAKSSVESEIEGLRYGADAYITKPFQMDLLVVRIDNLLEQRKRLHDQLNNNVLKVVELAPDEIVVTARDEEFIKNVIKTIEENLSNSNFNIEQIAVAVGMGRTTFFKKLKALTGMAPVEFLRDIKLKRGHQLLETGEFTISEIAFKLGFNDAGYFTKCYKEKYSTTPTEVLKSVKKK